MAMTAEKLAYHKAYREAHKEEARAACKRWYDQHGKEAREGRIESVREQGRAYYHRSKDSDRAREYAIANKAKRTAYYIKWVREHRQELNEYNRKRWFKDAYPEVIGIPDVPVSNCEICGSDRSICMDHCHQTKTFRGWLCRACNARVEHPGANNEYRERITGYLKRFQERQQMVNYSA